MLGRATGNLDSQDSSRPGLGESQQLPPYSILCASSRGPHSNDFLCRDLGVPKLSTLGLPQLSGLIPLCVNLWLRWGLNQSFSSSRELFNSMLHVTFMQVNLVDSQLLVVESQTANLTLRPSFGHNLCFKCPNGSCESILDIYVSIYFQWYKELFNAMGFDPCDYALKI